MKYVKITAKPNTWFKAGSEVFHEDSNYQRITLEEWLRITEPTYSGGGVGMIGIRVCEEGYEQEDCLNCKVGQEREDGEWCSIDEFDVEIIEKKI